MSLKSGRRGRRPRLTALACASVLASIAVATPLASGPPALARPAPWTSAAASPDPLAHAPRFRRAAGQQTLAEPAGLAVDAAGHVWVADTGHDEVVEFSVAGRELAAFGKSLDQPGQAAVLVYVDQSRVGESGEEFAD